VKRWRKGSWAIYEVENFRTLEAIRRMAEAKIREGGSRRMVNLSWWEEGERRSHSRIKVDWFINE